MYSRLPNNVFWWGNMTWLKQQTAGFMWLQQLRESHEKVSRTPNMPVPRAIEGKVKWVRKALRKSLPSIVYENVAAPSVGRVYGVKSSKSKGGGGQKQVRVQHGAVHHPSGSAVARHLVPLGPRRQPCFQSLVTLFESAHSSGIWSDCVFHARQCDQYAMAFEKRSYFLT